MKQFYISFLAITISSLSLIAQTPCNNGFAGPYPCDGYDLQSSISLAAMNASAGNDSWGWTDPISGKEYALVGLDNGTAFIDISNPTNPIYLGKLPTHTNSSTWRDVKTYSDHAFIVSEAGGHGMQVFDLTRLRNVPNPPQTFTEDAHYNQFGSAHNLVINEESGYAYAVGTGSYNGGPHFINIQDPTNPVAAGGYQMDNYSHDAQVITYCGPDTDYTGREILIGSNEDEVVIVDITDKGSPQGISTIDYTNVFYTHQGWFTEDHRYFIVGDELDELNIGGNTRTIVFDFNDLDNPQMDFIHEGQTEAIDHNGYVKGTKYYMANYRAGLRVFDVSDIANNGFTEEGFFDSFPTNNAAGFSGAWSVFPYFDSGNIVISDINRGFILTKASSGGDTTAPNAVCINITVPLDGNGEATISVDDVNNNSTDNSGIVYFKLCDTSFDCSNLGVNSVQLEVYDDFGNRSVCTANVTIVDEMDPIADCPANYSAGYDTGESFYTLPDFEAEGLISGTDNCADPVTINQNPAPGTQLTEGVYTVNFEVLDDELNETNCAVEVNVMEVLSVNDLEFQNSILIYPNPTNNIITITSNTEAISVVEVYDVLGKKILDRDNLSEETITVDISAFSNGIYFVKLNNRTTKKIIKQ